MESLAPGAPPLAFPLAIPDKLTLDTMEPATVEAVWVPWPSESRADRKKTLPKDSSGPFSASNPFR